MYALYTYYHDYDQHDAVVTVFLSKPTNTQIKKLLTNPYLDEHRIAAILRGEKVWDTDSGDRQRFASSYWLREIKEGEWL